MKTPQERTNRSRVALTPEGLKHAPSCRCLVVSGHEERSQRLGQGVRTHRAKHLALPGVPMNAVEDHVRHRQRLASLLSGNAYLCTSPHGRDELFQLAR